MTTTSMTGSQGPTGKNRGAPAGSSLPSGYRGASIQQFTPEQMNLFQGLFGQVGPQSQISQMASGSDAGFAPLENYANKQFQEFSGQNASRFSGLGMGGRKGSGFQNMQTQGAQDFASQLTMQRQGLQRQALMDLMGISNTLLGQRPQENFLVPKSKPWWQELLVQGGQAMGQAAGQAGGAALMAL